MPNIFKIDQSEVNESLQLSDADVSLVRARNNCRESFLLANNQVYISPPHFDGKRYGLNGGPNPSKTLGIRCGPFYRLTCVGV